MDAKFVKEYAAKKKLTKYEQNVLLKMEEKASAKNTPLKKRKNTRV